MKTLLIDYGASNLHSVHKALLRAGFDAVRSHDPEQAREAEVLVLPGQGHFRQVMEAFLRSGFEPALRDHLERGKPFLGICVGLQLLMNASEEAPGVPGLGILAGEVKRFDDPAVSVPQMGWNFFESYGNPPLLSGLPPKPYAYFANSYYADFDDARVPGALTSYGHTTFKSAISHGHLHATQFHPEKSQHIGLMILNNFRKLSQALLERH
ncbi:MAG: imidazole glycerol phosphate synthase subunit HisH [Deinococcota bacterium]|jgi:glutamine amidotransferase|nr:imidazole glycerol phosphate synthase subunit HisH [Deinococcota bacterium]